MLRDGDRKSWNNRYVFQKYFMITDVIGIIGRELNHSINVIDLILQDLYAFTFTFIFCYTMQVHYIF